MTPDAFAQQHLHEIKSRLGQPQITQDTLTTMERLAPDEVNKPQLLKWLNERLLKNDGRWETRTAIRCLAQVIQPRSYLEIGTRRGWSLAQVLSEAPQVQVYSCDMWVKDYGSVENPGADFVRAEMKRVVPDYRNPIIFLEGNSHDLLPIFLDGAPTAELPSLDLIRHTESRPHYFDLITVDGDHTALGAWWDLLDVMPHVALGGAVVFDDLLPQSDEQQGAQAQSLFANRRAPLTNPKNSLLDIWERIQRVFGNFAYLEIRDSIVPVGIAIRVR